MLAEVYDPYIHIQTRISGKFFAKFRALCFSTALLGRITKMPISRKHHYVSKFYLRNFVDPNLDGQLNVVDVESGNYFTSSPDNVCAERDFNRVNLEGSPIDVLEKSLAQFEGEASQAIDRVVLSGEYPSPEDLNWILNVMCLFAIRNPRFRATWQCAREHEIRVFGSMLADDKNLFESQMKSAQKAGYVKPNNVTHEEFRGFVEEERYKVDIPHDEFHDLEFKTFDKILPILSKRYWTLLVVKANSWKTITCDHPVVITPKSPSNRPVGIGTPYTDLIFPLSPELLMYGVHEDPLKEVVEISETRLAAFNTRIAFNSERHLFSSEENFVMWRDGEIVVFDSAA